MSKGNTNTDSRKKEVEELMKLHNKKEQQTPRVLSTVDRIHELEQLARKGDLIAFHEWKKLTKNDVVRVQIVKSDGREIGCINTSHGMLPVGIVRDVSGGGGGGVGFAVGFGF